MANQPFYKRQSFWLNIWVWWVGLFLLFTIIASTGFFIYVSWSPEEFIQSFSSALLAVITPFAGPIFSSYNISGITDITQIPSHIKVLFTDQPSGFNPSPATVIASPFVFIGLMIVAQWGGGKIKKSKKRAIYNLITLVIITATVDLLVDSFFGASIFKLILSSPIG